jgi:hypothetical protein
MGEEHSIVGDCMEDIRALSARLVALWETEDTDGEES